MKIGDLDIEIKRSKRKKTVTVNIERDGSVNAVAPFDCDDEIIRKELEAREYLICKHIANRKAVNKAYINRNFVNVQKTDDIHPAKTVIPVHLFKLFIPMAMQS